jgi:hypothetical protein
VPTVGSLAYSIVANTSNFTSGVTATKSELRDLKSAFLAGMDPVDKYSAAIEHLEGLSQRFPDKAAGIAPAIAQMRSEMAQASEKASLLSQVTSRIGLNIDPVSAAFRVGGMAADAFRETVSAVTDEMKRLDEVAKQAKTLGIGESSLVGLRRAAADISGVESGAFDAAFEKFASGIGEAAMTGKGPAAEALDRLGLNAGALSGMAPDQQLLEVAGALEQVENVNERLALSKGLLGKGGAELATMLAAGRDEIEALVADQRLLSQVDFVDFASIEAANDATGRLDAALQGITSIVASEFSPIIKELADDITSVFTADGGESMRETIKGLAEVTKGWLHAWDAIGNSEGFKLFMKAVELSMRYSGVGLAVDALQKAGDASYGVDEVIGSQIETTGRKDLFDNAAQVEEIARKATDAELKEKDRLAKAAEDFHVMEIKAELDLASAVEMAEKKKKAERLKAGEEIRKGMDAVNKEIAEKGERLAEQFKSPAAKLRDDLKELQDAHRLGSITDDVFQKGLLDLKGKARDMAFMDSGPRTVGAIRAGSVEALRAEFSGRADTEKQLEEQKKIEENTAEAKALLQEIRDQGRGGPALKEIA